MSKDTIEEYLLDDMVDTDNISWPGKADTKKKLRVDLGSAKGKFKMPIKFSGVVLDFETGYARTIGASSTDVISSEQPYLKDTVSSGTVRLDYATPITKKYKSKLKGFSANEDWKEIRQTLNRFILPKKQTIDDGINNQIKKYLTRGIYGEMVSALEYLSKLDDIAREEFDKPLITLEFDKSYWFKSNGDFKFTYNKFVENLKKFKVGKTGEANLIRAIQKVRKDIGVIGEFIDENEEFIDTIADYQDNEDIDEEIQELDFDEIDADETLSEEEKRQKKLMAQALIDRRKQIEQGEEAVEEEEAVAEEEGLSPEESIERRLSEQTAFGEGLSEEEEAQKDFWQTLVSWRDDKKIIERTSDSLGLLFTGIREVQKYKGNHIKTENFKNTLTNFLDMIGITKENSDRWLIKIEDVEKEGVDQKELKESIRKLKEDVNSRWDEIRTQPEFKSLSDSDYMELINMINLREVFATELVKNNTFNNAKLGGVTADSDNLRIEIDYLSRKILVKGNIKWNASKESIVGYKIQDRGGKDTQRLPKVPTDAPKSIKGRRVGPAGRVQAEGQYGRNYDATRKEFVDTIKQRTKALIAGVKS